MRRLSSELDDSQPWYERPSTRGLISWIASLSKIAITSLTVSDSSDLKIRMEDLRKGWEINYANYQLVILSLNLLISLVQRSLWLSRVVLRAANSPVQSETLELRTAISPVRRVISLSSLTNSSSDAPILVFNEETRSLNSETLASSLVVSVVTPSFSCLSKSSIISRTLTTFL